MHEVKVRTNADKNEAFAKTGLKETKISPDTKLVADTILEGNTISAQEYNSGR